MEPFLFFLHGFGAFLMVVFLVLPLVLLIIMIVKFFQISSDVRCIKRQMMNNNNTILGKLGEIEGKLSSFAVKPDTPDLFTGIWGAGITGADKKEVEPLLNKLSDMDGVVIRNTSDDRLDIWSRYYWDKYGKTDGRYKLIYKNYKD
ncbi:MAG: hypothetical protein RR293_06990 [Bacteroidales bacterium]